MNELQRDVTMQLEVFGFIDHTHPAAAELRQNAVVRNYLAEHPYKITRILRLAGSLYRIFRACREDSYDCTLAGVAFAHTSWLLATIAP